MIHNEDCLDTMSRMPDNYIDLTVTSPPYDNMRKYKGYSFEFEGIAQELYRITKQHGTLVWIVSDQIMNGNHSGTSFKQCLYFQKIGFNFLHNIIYEKTPQGAKGNSKSYWQVTENMFILTKGKIKTINLIMDRKNKEARDKDNGTKRQIDGTLTHETRGGYGEYGRRTNIWKYQTGRNHSSKDNIAYNHPAIFPEQLAEDHIVSWSNKGDLVYDPFMGSGTTGKMAQKLDRKFIGSEISKEYCDIARMRMS